MREIKFRAWDKMEKIMSDVIMLGGEENWKDGVMTKDYIGSWDRFEIQQFTGLKDKNGKEIYEGDIILIKDYYTDVVLDDGSGPSYEENQLLEVVFTNGCFGFNTEHSELFDKRFYSFDEYKKDISDEDVEVIGNIFENPELIK